MLSRREAVLLTSALVQWVAEGAGIRVLHLKGPLAETVLEFPRTWSDVDVWVDPRRVGDFVAVLEGVGFRRDAVQPNSVWSHSVDMVPTTPWASRVDVHRSFPGMATSPQSAFERLYADRMSVAVAGRGCDSPSRVAHALVLGLHAARSPQGSAKWVEASTAWEALREAERPALIALARDLGAEAALGVRWDAFAEHTTESDRRYWHAVAARDANAIWGLRLRNARSRPREIVLFLRSLAHYVALLIRLRDGSPRQVAAVLLLRARDTAGAMRSAPPNEGR